MNEDAGNKQLLPIMMFILLMVFPVQCGVSSERPVKEPPQKTASDNPAYKGLWIKKYPGNYTCFKLVISGVTIITDPFNMNEVVQPDIVTTSHHDPDHVDFSRLSGNYRRFETAGSFNEKGIEILGVAGHHNKGDKVTTNIIYIFSSAGLRLAQFASQGEMPTEELFRQIGTADILIIQIYGEERKKLSPAEACEIARRLKAKIIIPAHTDVELTDTLATLVGVPCEHILSGRLAVTKEGLAKQEIPRVVSLDDKAGTGGPELKTGI